MSRHSFFEMSRHAFSWFRNNVQGLLPLLTILLVFVVSSCKGSVEFLEPVFEDSTPNKAFFKERGLLPLIEEAKGNETYTALYVEVKDFASEKEYFKYADKKYKEVSKGKKQSILYVLLAYTEEERGVVLRTDEGQKLLMEGIAPDKLFQMELRAWRDPAEFIRSLVKYRSSAREAFMEMGFLKRMGIVNPILNVTDLLLDRLMLPGNSFIYRYVSFLPFGTGMVILSIARSLPLALAVCFLLCFLCFLGYRSASVKWKTIVWIALIVYFFYTAVCLLNTMQPSYDFFLRMRAFGYGTVAQTFYLTYYAQYHFTTSSILLVIVLMVVYILSELAADLVKYKYTKKTDLGNGDLLQGSFGLLAAALVCGNTLVLAVTGFFLIALLNAVNNYINLKWQWLDKVGFWVLIVLNILFGIAISGIHNAGAKINPTSEVWSTMWTAFWVTLLVISFIIAIFFWLYFFDEWNSKATIAEAYRKAKVELFGDDTSVPLQKAFLVTAFAGTAVGVAAIVLTFVVIVRQF